MKHDIDMLQRAASQAGVICFGGGIVHAFVDDGNLIDAISLALIGLTLIWSSSLRRQS